MGGNGSTRGNRTQIDLGNGTITTVTPDPISRIGGLSHNLNGSAQDFTIALTFNPASQIATYTRSNDTYAWSGHYNLNDAYALNGLNQITSAGSKSVGHDGRGNVTSIGAEAYAYTAENRMISGPGGATLQYDPLGRLYQISKSGLTTRFQYDGTDLVAEYDATNVLKRRYVQGPGADEPLLWYEGAGTSDRRFYHHDERGSVVAITDGAASAFAIKTYDEYGMPGGSTVGRFAFTGQTWLPEVGLYYYNARMYSPSLGRFMQTDPIGYRDGINWYAYARNDPLNFFDPTGTQAVDAPGLPGSEDNPPPPPPSPPKTNSPYEEDGVTLKPVKDGPYLDGEQTILRNPTGLGEKGQAAVDADLDRQEADDRAATARAKGDKKEEEKEKNKSATEKRTYEKLINQSARPPLRIHPDGSTGGDPQEDDKLVPQ